MPKKNITFARLSNAHKRKAIFADIIATLKRPRTTRYKVEQRVYVELAKAMGILTSDSLQKLLPKVEKKCTVCGIGACFISHVRLANKFTIGQMDMDDVVVDDGKITGTPKMDDDRIFEVVKKYFTVHQLRRVEAAFEGQFWGLRFGTSGHNATDDESLAAEKWFDIIPNSTNRLRAIAENGFRNNGNFNILELPKKPTKKAAVRARA